MAHVSWYRKYRPQSFDDVVGQLHIERTLRNAVGEGTVAHAYLFTGPRGTGKTSTARILAKALNCDRGPGPSPDGTCDQCQAIAEGTHPDVYELDAASRTGVDDVREQIIGRVNYAPTRGAWKVYIIDEVHMLSTSAFNALLKTLEEPPPHTLFVLCTTHPNKVPDTIHSRCQRFDFHRLSVEEIASRLRAIADAEHVTVADGALALIAKHALGGMRDAITTLEQLASFGEGTIELSDVEGLLGELDEDLLFEAAELVCDRDVAGAFRFVARLAEAGIDMTEFVRGLVRHCRDLFVVAAVGADGAVDTTSDDLERLEVQAARFGRDRLARVLGILGDLSTAMRAASDQRLAVEVALTRMARPESDLTLEALAERLERLEAGAPSPAAPRPTGVPEVRTPAPASAASLSEAAASLASSVDEPTLRAESPGRAPDASVVMEEPTPACPPVEDLKDIAAVKRAWPRILGEFRKRRPSRVHAFGGTEVELADGTLVVEFPESQAFAVNLVNDAEEVGLLRQSVAAVLGKDLPVEYRLGRSGGSSSSTAQPKSVHDGAAPDIGRAAAVDQTARPDAPALGEPSAIIPSAADDGDLPRVQDAAPAGAPAASTSDLEAAIIAELGAVIVDEIPLEGLSDDGEGTR